MKSKSHIRNQSFEHYEMYLKKTGSNLSKEFTNQEFIENCKIIHFGPNETYEGFVNEKKEPHGFGNLYFNNQDTYSGDFINGKREGSGSYTYVNNDDTYDGSWKNDMKDGDGVLTNNKTNKMYTVTYKEDRLISLLNNENYDNDNLFFISDMRSNSKYDNVDFLDLNRDSNASGIKNLNNRIILDPISPLKEMKHQLSNTEKKKLSYNKSIDSTIDI